MSTLQVDGNCKDGLLLHQIGQRYKCKSCGRTFVPNPIKPRNYSEEFKEVVVRAVVKEGVGIRQASRIFKLSPNTVTAWVKEFSKKDLRNKINQDNPVIELDEMWSFVRKKMKYGYGWL